MISSEEWERQIRNGRPKKEESLRPAKSWGDALLFIDKLEKKLEIAKEALEVMAYGEIHGGDNTDKFPFIAKEALKEIGE